MNGYRPTEMTIHTDILKSNLRILRKKTLNNFFCPMVKADAYGHGAIEVAAIAEAEGCRSVGVALFEEGIALRKEGFTDLEILVFSPLNDKALKACFLWELTPVISTQNDLDILRCGLSMGRSLKVHMKVNVGMNRLGFNLHAAAGIEMALRSIPGVSLRGVCCHLPEAEDADVVGGTTRTQLNSFLSYTSGRKFEYVHALNSESLLRLSRSNFSDLELLGARPGIALYGIGDPDLSPAMTLTSRIIHTQNLSTGEKVSYGGRWVAHRPSLIGVLPLGYADGLRRGLSHNLSVLAEGKVIPVVGTVCMDYIMVDVTDLKIDAPKINNLEVTVMDTQRKGFTVNDWSERLGTIPYEVMVGFGTRLRRNYR